MAAALCTCLMRVVPGSYANLTGSLSTAKADPYSDIDILWEVPAGSLPSAAAIAPEALGFGAPSGGTLWLVGSRAGAGRMLVSHDGGLTWQAPTF